MGEAAEKPTERERGVCWIDKKLIRRAKMIGADENKSISEILESLLRDPLDRKYDELLKR